MMVSATALLLLLSPVTAFTPFGVITRLSPATSSSSKLYSETATASGYVNAGGFDSAAVDVKIVEDLLVERNLYRDERNFEDADDVRNELQSMGVMVDDYERIWCLKGNEPPEFKRGKGGAGGSTFKGHPMQERDFGPFGHDYERSNGDKTDIDEAKMGEINDKIKARLEAKLARDFDTADGIKAELLDMGIELHDGKKQWRADGEDFNQYVKSGSFKIENEEMVKQLIGERSQAKRERDYDTADSIKARLVDEFNVMVDDRRMTYRVADNNSAWAKSEFSDELEADQEAGIKMLIEQRAKAKTVRDYKKADRLAEELMDRFKVIVDDAKRTYSTSIWEFTRTGNPLVGEGATEDGFVEADIVALVKKRGFAKYTREYRLADELRDTLRNKWGVEVDDKGRSWKRLDRGSVTAPEVAAVEAVEEVVEEVAEDVAVEE
ncbi:hypothetical protein ScalyP_jg5785 [Parmales sp. scaly parma]|nr:hypothetical protein ScalyP_jg5785 [Parmales sp. scaly parma]